MPGLCERGGLDARQVKVVGYQEELARETGYRAALAVAQPVNQIEAELVAPRGLELCVLPALRLLEA